RSSTSRASCAPTSKRNLAPRPFLSNKDPLVHQLLAECHHHGIIHDEDCDGCPPDGGFSHEIGAREAEVMVPLVPARVEQANEFCPRDSDVETADVWSLVP